MKLLQLRTTHTLIISRKPTQKMLSLHSSHPQLSLSILKDLHLLQCLLLILDFSIGLPLSKHSFKEQHQQLLSQNGESNSFQLTDLKKQVGVHGQYQELRVVGRMHLPILSLIHSVISEFSKVQPYKQTEVGSRVILQLVMSQIQSQWLISKLQKQILE